MTRPNHRARFALPALIVLLAIGSQHAAPGDPVVSQEPMFLQGSVKPAFIMAVDDSGSMQWEMLANNQDGEIMWGRDSSGGAWGFFEDNGTLRDGGYQYQYLNQDYNPDRNVTTGLYRDYLELFAFPNRGTKRNAIPPTVNFGFARSPGFNPAYFNPNVQYATWKKADGTSYESMDTVPEWNAIKTDPRDNGTVRFDLDSVVTKTTEVINGNLYTNNAWMFNFRTGMVIPSGTRYYEYGNYRYQDPDIYSVQDAECNGVTGGRRPTGFRTAATDIVVQEACLIGIEYFPATYYLTTNTSPDGNTAPVAFFNLAGGPRSSTVPSSGTLYRYEIRPGNYASPAAYNAAMTNFANWFLYYRTRNLSMIAAMTNSFDGEGLSLRAGFFTINSGARLYDCDSNGNNCKTAYDNYKNVVMRDIETGSDKTALYAQMIGLPAAGSTPNRWAVEHLGKQFSRTDDTNTDSGEGNDAPVRYGCQVNAGMLFTDGYSNLGGPAVGNYDSGAQFFGSSGSNTMADTAAKYYTASLRTGVAFDDKFSVPKACATNPNDKSLDCRNDPHMNFYGITLGALGVRYGAAPYIDLPGTSTDEARAAAVATNPTWVTPVDDERSAVDEIWHATLNSRGKFVNAKSPADITKALQEVLGSVTAPPTESGSRGAAGARISGGSNSFTIEPSFQANGSDWKGDLVAKAVKRNGELVTTPLWSAATKLDVRIFSTRKIIFAKQPGISTLIDKRLFTGTNVTFTDLGFGTTPVAIASRNAKYPSATETWMTDYLKGDDTYEKPKTGGIFRERSSVLGDIVNSPPLVASPKDNFGYYTRFDGAGEKYADYLAAKNTRKPVAYVGANDGMLHAFDASTTLCSGAFPDPSACQDAGSGDELFAFIPNGVVGKMNRLLDPDYGKGSNPHTYFVDGEINVVDVKDGLNWKTVLVGATGAGGRSVFGLNVSNPTGFGTGDVLWELNNTVAGFGNIGQTVGRPSILPLNIGTRTAPNTVWAALFGNGYGGDSRKASLFIVNVMTGALIREIPTNDLEPGVYNGLGEITAIDTDNDGHSDAVYGGDLRGNVWKFNVSGPSSSWGVSFGGQAFFTASVGGVRQPITGGFRISAGPSGGQTVLFGTGSFVFTADKVAGSALQSLYAVWDRKDNDAVPPGGRGNLIGQSITSETINALGTTRTISGNPVNYTSKFGWYLDLAYPLATPSGERFVGVPRVQNGKVFFATYTPNAADECGAGGKNFLYVLDLLSGQGALAGIKQLPGGTTSACTGSGCGAIALEQAGQKNVAPVMNTSVLVPQPMVPGVTCAPGSPGCPVAPVFQQCQVVIYPGAYVLRRPCDRQSWRQVR